MLAAKLMQPIKLYWCDRLVRGRKNFGDWISPELCRHLSGRAVEYASPRRAHLVAVGSILHRVPTHFWSRRVDVWGAGLMHEEVPGRAIHRYHALRGELTAKLAGAKSVGAFGDPGLLVDLLYPHFAEMSKRWDIGVVPHHVDQSSPSLAALAARVFGVRVLDILAGTQEFLSELAACRFVLSSSLHGCVAADAFGIPNAWVTISDQVRGAGFKFRDYYSVFQLPASGGRAIEKVDKHFIDRTTVDYQRPGLEQIKANLIRAFPYPR